MNAVMPPTLQDNAAESLDMSRLGAQLHEMTELYGQSRERIAQLEDQISRLQRRLFGVRSERYEANQFVMDLILKAGESASPAAVEPVVDVKATQRRKAKPHGRTEIPAHLEREDILLDLAQEQKVDAEGFPLVKLRDEISEKIAGRPGCWHVKRYIRPVYVPADRQSDAGVVCMPMPDSPIEKCKADNSVLALVAIHKWADPVLPAALRGTQEKSAFLPGAPHR